MTNMALGPPHTMFLDLRLPMHMTVLPLVFSITGKGVLNFSTQSLPPLACVILGKLLARTSSVYQILCNDCMLPADSVRALLVGLCKNTSVKSLEVKGNAIQGSTVEAFGKLLRHNTSITRLSLEWNYLGIYPEYFSLFCDGLAVNSSLEHLDLRNNQLTHECGSLLANSLKTNTVLKFLDLKWNNLGHLGGKSLLKCFQFNKTLTHLDTTGNHIINDITVALLNAVANNTNVENLTTDYKTRTTILSRHIDQLEKDTTSKVNDLLYHLKLKDDEMKQVKLNSSFRIGQLEEALEDRKSVVNSMSRRVSMLENSLTDSENRIQLTHEALEECRNEAKRMRDSHNETLRAERESWEVKQQHFTQEIQNLCSKRKELECLVDSLNSQVETGKKELIQLKEKIFALQNSQQEKEAIWRDESHKQKEDFLEEIRETQNQRKTEMSQLRQERDEIENSLHSRIHKLEEDKMQQKTEIATLKSVLSQERLQSGETLQNMQSQLKAEQEQNVNVLDSKIVTLTEMNHELSRKWKIQSSLVVQLESARNKLEAEHETLKHDMEKLNMELQGKNKELQAATNQAYQQAIDEHAGSCEQSLKLQKRVERLEERLAEEHKAREADKNHWQEEIRLLQQKLATKEQELMETRDNEYQRATQLQSACKQYLQGVKHHSST